MTSSLTLQVGNLTSTITFSKTDTQTGQVLRWFIASKVTPPAEGLTVAQKNQYYLDEAAAEIVRLIRQEAQRTRFRELRAEQASIEQTAENETAI